MSTVRFIKASGIVAIAISCVFCTRTPQEFSSNEEYLIDSLYVATSVGAFNNDRLVKIYPQDAYIALNWLSTDKVSLTIKYSWRNDRSGFMTEIPDIKVIGTRDDFYTTEDLYEAHCECWESRIIRESNTTMSVSFSFKHSAEGVIASLVLTPSDKSVFPVLKISKVSTHRINFERVGGSIVEYIFEYYTFNNKLDVPVSIQWDHILYEPIEVDPRMSKSFDPGSAAISYFIESLIRNPMDRPSYPAIVTANGKSVEYDFFAKGCFSKEDLLDFHLDSGEIEAVDYTKYSFTVTQDYFN